MNVQTEEMARRVHAARLARVSAQRTRLLAAQRVEKLERELKDAAEAGLKAEISRGIAARASLQTVVKRKRAARYAGIGAFGVMLCAATLGLAWAPPAQNAAGLAQLASQAPVLDAAPGDRLKLTFSYSVSQPTVR